MLRQADFCAGCILSIGLVSVLSSPAAAATFSFTIFDAGNNGEGVVQGLIFGLPLDGVDQPATQVEVTASTLGFGLGTYGGSPLANQFTTEGGKIVSEYWSGVRFESFGSLNSPPDETNNSLGFTSYRGAVVGSLTSSKGFLEYAFSTPVVFKLVDESPADVPEPSILWGLGGLGIAAIIKRRLLSRTSYASSVLTN